MKITKRQLTRIIREEIISDVRRKSSTHQHLNELGFLDKAMDFMGDIFGSDMPELKAVSMKKAEKVLAQALATYAMSTITTETGEGGDISSSNFSSEFDAGLKKAMDAAKTSGNTLSKKIKSSKISSKAKKEKEKKKGGGLLGAIGRQFTGSSQESK